MNPHEQTLIADGHLGGFVQGGDANTWYPELWNWMIAHFEARSVLDIGCGEGHAASFFANLGCKVFAVDGSRKVLSGSPCPELITIHDFTRGPYQPVEKPDVIWCCEFVEHVSPEYEKHVLNTFVGACGKALLMSHAVPGQPGYHHVNCQSDRYWIETIQAMGLRFDYQRTLTSRRLAAPNPSRPRSYFAHSGLVFVR